jgi:uncharacterized protein
MITAKETLDYVLRDLTSPEGGFYSAEDADSEGEEGKFYLWTLAEFKEVLPPELADFAIKLFGVKPEGNYVEPPKGRNGKNILHLAVPLEDMATQSNISVDQVIGKLAKITQLLYLAREKRVHPAKDDKVLTDWNGLMIAALAKANQVLGDKKYLQAAKKSADFILSEMQTNDHRLYHRYAKGEKAINGFLDDYAFLVYGLIELYEAGFEEKHLQASVELTNVMIGEFWDEVNGGFYFTSKTGEADVPRIKQNYDGAVPSGNSVALHDLLRLSRLANEVSFEQYASKMLGAFAEDIKGYPMGHTFMLAGLDFLLGPSYNVIVAGNPADNDTQSMLATLRRQYIPNLTLTLWTPEKAKAAPAGVSYEKIDGKATAYVCKNQTCMPPTTEVEKMLEYLEKPKTTDK